MHIEREKERNVMHAFFICLTQYIRVLLSPVLLSPVLLSLKVKDSQHLTLQNNHLHSSSACLPDSS